MVRDLGERGFYEMTDGRGRGEPFARSSLIAEETTLTATYGGKKNRNDQRGHWVLLELYDFGLLVIELILLMSNAKIQI
jgi:hypothetical protein